MRSFYFHLRVGKNEKEKVRIIRFFSYSAWKAHFNGHVLFDHIFLFSYYLVIHHIRTNCLQNKNGEIIVVCTYVRVNKNNNSINMNNNDVVIQ